MQAILITLSPFITSMIVSWLKQMTAFASMSDQGRTVAIRLLAAAIALVYTILGMWVTGTVTPDMLTNSVNAFMLALLAWLGSMGVFHAFFQKKATVAPAA